MEEKKLLKRRSKALRVNNETALVAACTDLANLYMDEGRFDFAIEEYTTAAKIYQKQNKILDYALVNRGIGEAYLGLNKYDKALHHQKIHLEFAKTSKNKLEEQRALATIGHIYLTSYLNSDEGDKSNLNSAYKFLVKSLIICQNFSNEISQFEVADMSARLFSNLGLVQDCLGNFDKAAKLITKSINLCKEHDIYEQLQRGYLSLASLLDKKGDSKAALQQYNLAIETSKKLKNVPILLANALMSKAELLTKLGDFHAAKSVLVKAYKLKLTNAKERKTIERNLRIVVSMCNNEDKLVTTHTSNYKELKSLYEKMGDGACELKCYDKAIDYYKKMLESAMKSGLKGTDLAACYYSLAETFKDNSQYDHAVEYFEKELELCKDSLKDSLNTLSKIADTKEAGNFPISEIHAIYKRAIEDCRRCGNNHEEGRMLKRCICFLRRQNLHAEAFKLENELAKLDYHSSDTDTESSEASSEITIGAEIDLEAISDISDDSDVEQPTNRLRRRTKNFIIKKNMKGETQLHIACINGKMNIVKHLLEQGHPVNVRDNCGWLPLHEACICGHLEIVELLLERGAAINDRGGTHCGGVTPLHDAASNGHLAIVQLLLSKGANAVAKTDDGETVLQSLKKWRATEQIDESSENIYQAILTEISQALKKVGAGKEATVSSEISPNSSKVESLRRSAIVGWDDEDSSESLGDVTQDYKSVMNNLRHKRTPQKETHYIKESLKRPALLAADEVVDDWLIDDVGKRSKKRKTGSFFKIAESPSMMVLPDERESYYLGPESTPTTSAARSPVKKKPKKQMRLTNFGHARTFVEADSTSGTTVKKTKSSSISRSVSFDNNQLVMDPMLSVDVKINEKLYRVPILLSQVNSRTIKWLAEEAASRCARKEYMKPILELQTKTGAILADDDLVSLLFPMGTAQSEQVEARVIKWNIPPLLDRFKEACQSLNVISHDLICRHLEEKSTSLDLSNNGLNGASLAPLCKALNRQSTLQELDLSGNFLTSECLQFLANSLPSLINLQKLNLSCTGLTTQILRELTNGLSSDNTPSKLRELNFSENLLDDYSLESLALLTHRYQLKKLNLSLNNFTKFAFTYSSTKNIFLNLCQLEELDLSNNNFSDDALIKIVTWVDSAQIKYLNFSSNCVTHEFLKKIIALWSECGDIKLKSMKLSRCHIQDADLFDLLGITSSLECLDLSYNNELTSSSLKRLLQYDNLTEIYLYGCEKIFDNFRDFSKYLYISDLNQAKKLKVNIDLKKNLLEYKELIELWKSWYGESAVIEQNSYILCLSTLKK